MLRILEEILLDHPAAHTRAGDSYLAALVDRRLSRPVTRCLLGWPITPSQITLASEKLASRDYTYLLLVCVIAGHIEWFLYVAALGSWAFVAGLVAYRAYVGSTGHRQATSR